MPRTSAEMNDAERGEYLILQERMGSALTTEEEKKQARRRMDELEWVGKGKWSGELASEVAELKVAVAELKERVGRRPGLTKPVDDAFKALAGQLDVMTASEKAMQEQLRQHQGQINGMVDSVTDSAREVLRQEAIKGEGDVEELKAQLQSTVAKVELLSKKNDAIQVIRDQITKVLPQRIEAIEQKVAQQPKEIREAIDEQLTALKQGVRKEAVTAAVKAVGELDLSKTVQAQVAKVLPSKLGVLEQKVAQQPKEIYDAVEQQLTVVKGGIHKEAVAAAVKAVGELLGDKKISAMEAEIEKQRQALNDLVADSMDAAKSAINEEAVAAAVKAVSELIGEPTK